MEVVVDHAFGEYGLPSVLVDVVVSFLRPRNYLFSSKEKSVSEDGRKVPSLSSDRYPRAFVCDDPIKECMSEWRLCITSQREWSILLLSDPTTSIFHENADSLEFTNDGYVLDPDKKLATRWTFMSSSNNLYHKNTTTTTDLSLYFDTRRGRVSVTIHSVKESIANILRVSNFHIGVIFQDIDNLGWLFPAVKIHGPSHIAIGNGSDNTANHLLFITEGVNSSKKDFSKFKWCIVISIAILTIATVIAPIVVVLSQNSYI